MLSSTDAGAPAGAERPVGDILEPRERLEFEHLLQWLRLSFLLTPILILLAFGLPAVPYAIGVAIAVCLSFTWVGLLMRYRPRLLLRIQLWLRILDCGLVYLILVWYHGFLHDAYYDTVYLLFVVAAAATHGRTGAWTLSGVAGLAVLASRLQLIATGALHFEPRHITDAVFYTLFFLATSTAVASLMYKAATTVSRRERALHAAISERNAALERTAGELAESIRLRDAMLTGVTHDLRAPVTVVKVQAQVLRRRADPQLLVGIDRIERAATRMARWIDELLEVSTLRSAEGLQLNLELTDLVRLAHDAVDEHQQNDRRHDVTFVAEVREIVGLFDAPRMQRVLDNLLGNAIKYSPERGQIRLEVSAHDGWATITVSDQGVGIPAEDVPHVFEPFVRAGNVVGRFSGTGIGLASAQRIVQGHGGTLSVESEPDKGSMFTIRLPLTPAPD